MRFDRRRNTPGWRAPRQSDHSPRIDFHWPFASVRFSAVMAYRRRRSANTDPELIPGLALTSHQRGALARMTHLDEQWMQQMARRRGTSAAEGVQGAEESEGYLRALHPQVSVSTRKCSGYA